MIITILGHAGKHDLNSMLTHSYYTQWEITAFSELYMASRLVGIWNENFILQYKTFPIFITKSSNDTRNNFPPSSPQGCKTSTHIGFYIWRSAHENLLNWFTSRLLYFMVDRALCCCSSRQALAIFLHTHGLNYLKITFLSPSTHKFISLLTMLPCFISALLIQHSYIRTHTHVYEEFSDRWTNSRWSHYKPTLHYISNFIAMKIVTRG